MKTLMATLVIAGTSLMAQTATTPAPAAGGTTAPAKVKKHHKGKKHAAAPATKSDAAPATK